MNPEPEMFMKKLQMLVSACVSIDQKIYGSKSGSN
jgi:hypothetical protein